MLRFSFVVGEKGNQQSGDAVRPSFLLRHKGVSEYTMGTARRWNVIAINARRMRRVDLSLSLSLSLLVTTQRSMVPEGPCLPRDSRRQG